MPMYECERCFYKTQRKNDLKKHMTRKKPCEAVKQQQQQQNTQHRENSNTATEAAEAVEATAIIHPTSQSIQINNAQNVTIIQNNITINAFGKEKTEHITKQFMQTFLKEPDVLMLAESLYFNPEVPENHNVKRITSSKDYYKNQFLATFHEDGTWKHHVKETVFRAMLQKVYQTIITHINDMKDDKSISENDYITLNQWLVNNHNNPKQFMKQLFTFLLNNDIM